MSTRNALLAAEIRAEMARQRMSGRELARRVDKPETTVARYLRGETAMSIDDVEDFARALDVTTIDLVERAYRAELPTPPIGESRRNNPCYSDSTVILGPWSTAIPQAAAA